MQVLPSVHEQSVAAANAIIDYLEQRPGVLTQVDTIGWYDGRAPCASCASTGQRESRDWRIEHGPRILPTCVDVDPVVATRVASAA